MTTLLLRMSFALLCCVLLCPAQETIALKSADGQRLEATLRKPPSGTAAKGGVVLLHMHRSNRSAFDAFGARLATQGFITIAPDLRGHGDSALNEQGTPIEVPRENTPANPALLMNGDLIAAHDALIAAGAPASSILWLGAELGAAVAVHTCAAAARRPTALVLLTPIRQLCALDVLQSAKGCRETATLIVSAEEDAELGARLLSEALTTRCTLRNLQERNVLGSRMLGRVPGLEADLITWMEEALRTEQVLDIPLTRSVILDGELSATEAEGATLVTIPLPGAAKQAGVRLSRNRTKLLLGVSVGERFLNNNSFTLYLEARGEGAGALNAQCHALEVKPLGATHEVRVFSGASGAWKPATLAGLQSQVRTSDPNCWTAEVAVPLEALGIGENIRMAFAVNGQKKNEITLWPAGVGLELTPRRWLRARLR